MSLTAIMNTANSGLSAAQTQLRVVSDNVSNVNTPGYVRKIADQQSVTSQGVGTGVEVTRIRLATDRFLQAASMSANSEASRQGVRYELYDRIQSLFGDPGGDAGRRRAGLSAPGPAHRAPARAAAGPVSIRTG